MNGNVIMWVFVVACTGFLIFLYAAIKAVPKMERRLEARRHAGYLRDTHNRMSA